MHLRRIDVQRSTLLLVADDALVFHSLQGDIVQVLTTFGVGIEGVPAGGNSSKSLDVVGILARIEEQRALTVDGDILEQGEIGVCTHGLLEDVVALHVIFVGIYHLLDDGGNGVDAQRRVVGNSLTTRLQTDLAESKLFHLLVFR